MTLFPFPHHRDISKIQGRKGISKSLSNKRGNIFFFCVDWIAENGGHSVLCTTKEGLSC
jgi:hypothetical protein